MSFFGLKNKMFHDKTKRIDISYHFVILLCLMIWLL